MTLFISNSVLLFSQCWKVKAVKIWILSKFFLITVFMTVGDKMTSLTLWSFLKNLLQSVTNGVLKSDKKFHEFKSNHYKKLWQKVITKFDRYYKVRQNLLQSVTGIAKCDNYYVTALISLLILLSLKGIQLFDCFIRLSSNVFYRL